jgi:hypothetical protein
VASTPYGAYIYAWDPRGGNILINLLHTLSLQSSTLQYTPDLSKSFQHDQLCRRRQPARLHPSAYRKRLQLPMGHLCHHGSVSRARRLTLTPRFDLGIFFYHLTVPRGKRVFYQLAIIILTVAAISYYTMASDLGGIPVQIEFSHADNFALGSTRAVWVSNAISHLAGQTFMISMSDTYTPSSRHPSCCFASFCLPVSPCLISSLPSFFQSPRSLCGYQEVSSHRNTNGAILPLPSLARVVSKGVFGEAASDL